MVKTLRPSPEAFRRFGWHPASQKVYDDFMNDLASQIHTVYKSTEARLLPAIQEFKDFIDSQPTVYQEFVRMFEGVTESVGLLQLSSSVHG